MTRADGVVTFQDVNRHLDEEEREGGLDLPELFDARGAETDLTSEQVRRLVQRAARAARTIPLGPTAIVATDDNLYGWRGCTSILAEGVGVPLRGSEMWIRPNGG